MRAALQRTAVHTHNSTLSISGWSTSLRAFQAQLIPRALPGAALHSSYSARSLAAASKFKAPAQPEQQQQQQQQHRQQHSMASSTEAVGSGAASANGGDARLAALRAIMAKADGGRGVDAYIVPTEDPHMSEYSPECFKRREFISRFTGTAGTAVVTASQALLWTDGRYFLQASQELGKEWTLMKAGTPGVPDMEDWLAQHAGRVGIDPFLHTVDGVRRLQKKLEDAGKTLVPMLQDGNLVDAAWGGEQPAPPANPLRVHSIKWAGEEVGHKLKRMRSLLEGCKADALLVSMLDEVAWLMNLRGSDVSYNPVFIGYSLVGADGTAALYVAPDKVTPEVAEHLKAAGVEARPYTQFVEYVKARAAAGQTLWIDPSKVSYAVYQAAKEAAAAASQAARSSRKRAREGEEGADGDAAAAAAAAAEPAAAPGAAGAAKAAAPGAAGAAKPTFVEFASPVIAAKAVKNAAELEGMREAHLRDAVAIAEFLSQLEQDVAAGRALTEVDVDRELTARRAAQQGFLELSFPTIAGAGPNGAIIHYRPQEGSCREVTADTLLLLDSGGQYDCGTTDITRTMHFGTPTAYQRRCYTRVLQGHIALDSAIFPEGTPGALLDTLARTPLWSDGLNYRHGTGHGVGAALNVHEGPQAISMRLHITTPLQARMVCSNEPGYYEDGSFGIRIENLVVVKEACTPHRFGGQTYFGFDRLTMVPIQAKMMDTSVMSEKEVAWVDDYHKQVWAAVSPRLAHSPRALEWLRTNTRPLKEQQQQQK